MQLARLRESRRERRHRHESYEILPLPGLPIPCYRVQRFGLPVGHYLEGVWEKDPPDVIYVATEGPLGYSALASANRLGVPAVSGFHTRFDSYSNHYGLGLLRPVAERYLRSFHRRSACTVAPTEELCAKLRRDGFGEVQAVGRGINARRFSPAKRSGELRESWGAGDDDPVVIYVGRIAEEKNIHLAARAFREIHRVRPEARFVLVGDGPARESLEKENPYFHFSGWRTGEDLARHYASGDVFLFCLALYKTIKSRTRRPRPCAVDTDICRAVPPLDRYSFPSGHTMHAVALTLVAVTAYPLLGCILIPFTLLVAASRVVLGLHYPSDVVAGALIGAASSLLVLQL
jgi:glycosyltransferase involved in cell wall biosynthesis